MIFTQNQAVLTNYKQYHQEFIPQAPGIQTIQLSKTLMKNYDNIFVFKNGLKLRPEVDYVFLGLQGTELSTDENIITAIRTKASLETTDIINIEVAIISGEYIDYDLIRTYILEFQGRSAHASTHGVGGFDPITTLGDVTITKALIKDANLTQASLGPLTEKSQNIGTISGGVTIDLSKGLFIVATIGGETVINFSNAPVCGSTVILMTLTNGGSATVTWPTTIAWADSTAPALTAAGKDMIVLVTDDGGVSWLGNAAFEFGVGA